MWRGEYQDRGIKLYFEPGKERGTMLHPKHIIIILCIYFQIVGNIVQNQFLEPQTTIFQKLIKIIESGNDGGVEAVRKVIDLYQSCMDATTIENLGVTPLLDLIETLGTLIECSSL